LENLQDSVDHELFQFLSGVLRDQLVLLKQNVTVLDILASNRRVCVCVCVRVCVCAEARMWLDLWITAAGGRLHGVWRPQLNLPSSQKCLSKQRAEQWSAMNPNILTDSVEQKSIVLLQH